jgi:hypothetical protein
MKKQLFLWRTLIFILLAFLSEAQAIYVGTIMD